MARYIRGAEGDLVEVAKYDTSLMLTLLDIFPNNSLLAREFLAKKKDAPAGKLRDIYSTQCNSALVRKIFRLFVKNIIGDIITGNCQFLMPGRSNSSIYMGKHKQQFVRGGRFDLLATNYTVPYVRYKISRATNKKEDLFVYVNKSMYSDLIDRANTGKVFSQRPRDINHFLPYIYSEFSYIKEDCLKKLLSFCFRRMNYYLKRGEELRITDREGEIRFFRSLGKVHDEVMRKVVNTRKARERNKKLKDGSIS